jgi:hypothetical protein
MPLPIFVQGNLEDRPHVSFSEAYTASCCPYKHWEQYRLKKPQEDTIYTVFGKAVGESIEKYKKYGQKMSWISIGKKIFRFVLDHGWPEKMEEKDRDWRVWTRAGLRIFKDTLEFLDEEFPWWELIDFEYPIYEEILGRGKKFKGFIDLIFKWNGKIYIIDFKTTASGWFKQQLEDTHKLYQVTLYKYFYCLKTGTDPSNVETAYLLLKRKPAKKATTSVQLLEQTSGKVKMGNAVSWLSKQIELIETGIKIKSPTTCSFCVCGLAKRK